VTAYCLLAFLITWGSKYLNSIIVTGNDLPAFNISLIGKFGPSIAAVILIALTEGKIGLRRTVQSMLNWRVGARWILMAALFEFVMFSSFVLLYWIRYDAFPALNGAAIVSGTFSLIQTFIVGIFIWGLAEEIGWRGWMFPKLQNRLSPFNATMILAAVTTLWHIHPNSLSQIAVSKTDVYLIGTYPEFVERLIITIPISLVITYIFNNTQGSLLAMIFFHSGSNTSYFWIKETFGVVETGFFKTSFLVTLIIIAIIFSILVLRQKDKKIFHTASNQD
jgi:uncharacterized protein